MCGRLNIDGKEVLSLLEDLFDLDCSVTTNRNAAPSEFVEVLIKQVDRAVELRRMKWWVYAGLVWLSKASVYDFQC